MVADVLRGELLVSIPLAVVTAGAFFAGFAATGLGLATGLAVGGLLGVSPLVVSAAGVTVSPFLVAVGRWVSFRYAARSFERFTVE